MTTRDTLDRDTWREHVRWYPVDFVFESFKYESISRILIGCGCARCERAKKPARGS